jgi:acetyl-CoA carboxylase carboxyl transferase subunit beta
MMSMTFKDVQQARTQKEAAAASAAPVAAAIIPTDANEPAGVAQGSGRGRNRGQRKGKGRGERVSGGYTQDFDFLGGSLGMAAGEAIVAGADYALTNHTPFIIFTASGGARMQEGMFSLMQMPRTTIAIQRLRKAQLPYIVVLTNPTTGGVTASYAMLGDIQIAEPGAIIGFAGARVIEQTIREKLPEGFQRAEYLRDHGMVDMVVSRHDMRDTLARLCGLLTKSPPRKDP